jgi:hypothetical protein
MVIINLEFSDLTTARQGIFGGRSSDYFDFDADSFISVNGIVVSRIQNLINSSATGSLTASIDGSSSVTAGAGFVLSTSSISAVATTPGVGN